MTIEQKLAKYEISDEDCLRVQGGYAIPEVLDFLTTQGESFITMLVEEAEKPDQSI